jgi:Tol biopolymer transport system component
MPRILFTSDRRGDLDIYIMQENGNDIQRVVGRKGADRNPVFSPLKGRVAYIAAPDPAGTSGGAIVTVNADGKKARTLYSGDKRASSLSWSPDESRIVFAADSENGGSDIFVMNADGSNRRQITRGGSRNTEPVFGPDGSRVVFVSDRDGVPALYMMKADGTDTAERISPTSLTGACSTPVHSPNGRFMAFSCGDKTHSDIYLINVDGTNLRRLTDSPSINTSPVFNPDSYRIAFSSNRTGSFAIYAMDLDGKNLQQITFGTSNDTQPSWEQ